MLSVEDTNCIWCQSVLRHLLEDQGRKGVSQKRDVGMCNGAKQEFGRVEGCK